MHAFRERLEKARQVKVKESFTGPGSLVAEFISPEQFGSIRGYIK